MERTTIRDGAGLSAATPRRPIGRRRGAHGRRCHDSAPGTSHPGSLTTPPSGSRRTGGASGRGLRKDPIGRRETSAGRSGTTKSGASATSPIRMHGPPSIGATHGHPPDASGSIPAMRLPSLDGWPKAHRDVNRCTRCDVDDASPGLLAFLDHADIGIFPAVGRPSSGVVDAVVHYPGELFDGSAVQRVQEDRRTAAPRP